MALQNELEINHAFGEIIGKTEKMQHLFTQIQTAAAGDISVLIQGETGTGKELIAKAIHDNSQRKARPFVAINCAAIPTDLIESQLFGNEPGAFTGASERRIGYFEQADTGTLFFDEIGDMPLIFQMKLLRVLQEREFQRLGGTSTIATDIRVLAATNQDLKDALRDGYFREDLYHRLAAFPITVPPLRDRRGDIPILADHFLKKYAAAAENPIRDISTDALQMLIQHDFPGNVRELENVIERAVLYETTDLLQPQSLLLHQTRGGSQQATSGPTDATTILPLDEVERRVIVHALKVTSNNTSDAAEALGIGRTTLYRKMKKYNLPS
ncbi:MAG: sigma-54 dependent transcriptional regulator [Candidatus Poribacteria bacterium]|nr:sigma-54 dependent transcriptional regulator [Candidatus Poribacteria bacterium]